MGYQMNFGPVLARTDLLVQGAIDTIVLSAQCIVIGLALGLIAAIIRTNGQRWAGAIVAVYVETFRNTPLLVQLFLIFFGLPYIGLRLSAEQAALFAVSINLGAYSTEIFRAGLMAIPKTQIEAGLALGLSKLQVMLHIVIVPALQVIYPALTGQLTLTLLGTSIVSAVSASELTLAGARIESQTFRSLETFLLVAAIYISITFAFRLVYWLIGLWLFRRKKPASLSDAAAMQPVDGGRS